MYRLEEVSIHMDATEKRTASRHISAMLDPSQMQSTFTNLLLIRGGGLCMVEDNSR